MTWWRGLALAFLASSTTCIVLWTYGLATGLVGPIAWAGAPVALAASIALAAAIWHH